MINLFPTRVAIGVAKPDGKVYMSDEFSRALSDLLERMGGALGMSTDDIAAEIATGNALGSVGQMQQQIEALQLEVAALSAQLAAQPPIDAEVLAPALTDWEHP